MYVCVVLSDLNKSFLFQSLTEYSFSLRFLAEFVCFDLARLTHIFVFLELQLSSNTGETQRTLMMTPYYMYSGNCTLSHKVVPYS